MLIFLGYNGIMVILAGEKVTDEQIKLQELSADLRRASYFFQQNDIGLAQKFVDRSQKYSLSENIKNLILKIRNYDNLKASEMAMTASLIL